MPRMFARKVIRAVWRQSALQRHMSCNMGGGGPECSDTPANPTAAATGSLKMLSTPVSLWSLLPKTKLERAAVVCVEGGVEMSHQQLQGQSLSFAGRLTRDLGYGVGDKLALVLGGNYVESIIVQLAAAAAGITVVTADTPEDTALEGCRGMVLSAHLLHANTQRLLEYLPQQTYLEGERHPPIVAHHDETTGAAWGQHSGVLLWQHAVDHPPLEGDVEAMDPSLSFAVYAGAKAADRHLSQGAAASLAQDMRAEMELSENDRVALPVTLSEPFGFASGALATLHAGGAVILPGAGRHVDLQKTVAALERHQPTVLFLDRAMLKALQDQNVTISSKTLRKGVVKIGSGWAFNQENASWNRPDKFKAYDSLPLLTVGRGLPKRTGW